MSHGWPKYLVKVGFFDMYGKTFIMLKAGQWMYTRYFTMPYWLHRVVYIGHRWQQRGWRLRKFRDALAKPWKDQYHQKPVVIVDEIEELQVSETGARAKLKVNSPCD